MPGRSNRWIAASLSPATSRLYRGSAAGSDQARDHPFRPETRTIAGSDDAGSPPRGRDRDLESVDVLRWSASGQLRISVGVRRPSRFAPGLAIPPSTFFLRP